jgi:hypothetical protein
MDTDELTQMAYDIIVKASLILDVLKTDIAVRSSKHDHEDSFLAGTLSFIKKTIKYAEDYLDYWGHADDIGINEFKKKLVELEKYVLKVMKTPISERGAIPFE